MLRRSVLAEVALSRALTFVASEDFHALRERKCLREGTPRVSKGPSPGRTIQHS